jgi:hypothetical protein
MIVNCPHCGEPVVVNGLGRKRLNIPLKNICEALCSCGNVAAAARQLQCRDGYIFNALKAQGLKPADVIRRRPQARTLMSGETEGGDPPWGAVTGGDEMST